MATTRKFRRAKQKRAKKDLNKKIGLFNKLGDECLVCEEPFDKKSKEQVQNWFVTVREEQGTVNLYCPECWRAAQKVIEEFNNKEVNNDSRIYENEKKCEDTD